MTPHTTMRLPVHAGLGAWSIAHREPADAGVAAHRANSVKLTVPTGRRRLDGTEITDVVTVTYLACEPEPDAPGTEPRALSAAMADHYGMVACPVCFGGAS